MKRIVAVIVVAAAAFVGTGSAAGADDTLYALEVDIEASVAGQPVVEATATSSAYRQGDSWFSEREFEASVAGTGPTQATGGSDLNCVGTTVGATTCAVLDVLASL